MSTLSIIFLILLVCTVSTTIIFFLAAKNASELIVGDPNWHGTIDEVKDFGQPRYVYSDGTESVRVKFGVPIIGYRISRTLVIATGSYSLISASDVGEYAKKLSLKLIDADDLFTIKGQKDILDTMRYIVGDAHLPEFPIWTQSGPNFAVYDGQRFWEPNRGRANIICKL